MQSDDPATQGLQPSYGADSGSYQYGGTSNSQPPSEQYSQQTQQYSQQTQQYAEPNMQQYPPIPENFSILDAILWFFILIFLAWWVASASATCYIFLLPFVACFPDLQATADFLLKGMQIPLYCAEAMVAGRRLF